MSTVKETRIYGRARRGRPFNSSPRVNSDRQLVERTCEQDQGAVSRPLLLRDIKETPRVEEYIVGYTNIPSKTPTIKSKKRSDSSINREHLIQTRVDYNDIQRDTAKSVKERNAIEERKIALKEQKIAAIVERNKLEQKKIDSINNMSNILLNLMATKLLKENV